MPSKLLSEVLTEINNDITLLETTYKPTGPGSPLHMIFKHAFLPKWKFILPEGEPPYKKEEGPEGMSTSNMITETRRFHYLCDQNSKPMVRENVFISMLEAIHPKDAAVLLAIKDQKLNSLYPKITIRSLIKAGYLPPLPTDGSGPVLEPEPIQKHDSPPLIKRNRGRPRSNVSY